MMSKAQEGGQDFKAELFALACGPHIEVKTYSMCAVNLVWFVTFDRESGKKTQNNGVSTGGDHELVDTCFYGVLKGIKELTTLTRNINGQLFCLPVTGIVLNMKMTSGLSCKSMMAASEASTFLVYGTRMISISCQHRQKSVLCGRPIAGTKVADSSKF